VCLVTASLSCHHIKLALGRGAHSSVALAAAAELRSALDARSAEASLYRKQYESLCRKLDCLEEQHRQASAAARAKVLPSPQKKNKREEKRLRLSSSS